MEPVSKLFLAPPALSGCVLAAIYRDTRGAALAEPDRFNHFPATPLVTATLVRHGELRLTAQASDWREAACAPAQPRIFVMAPNDTPVTSWASGDLEAITIGVYPDAYRALGGDPAQGEPPQCLAVALEAFVATADPAAGWAAFCEALAPVWAKGRAAPATMITDLADWARSLAARAALSGTGRSLRSIERRMKRLSGHTRRTVDFFAALENLQAVAHRNAGKPLAEIALEAGYADQSHMGRAVRRATGFSPARLNQAIQTEEAFWCYRLLGERF